jgi:RHH-type transcriptional regulator, rel operon repressor / antitoxin RelB
LMGFTMTTTIELDPGIEQRLTKLADTTGRSMNFFLKHLIEEGVSDLEDYYLAAEVSERVRKGEEKTYSSADVREELGLGY